MTMHRHGALCLGCNQRGTPLYVYADAWEANNRGHFHAFCKTCGCNTIWQMD